MEESYIFLFNFIEPLRDVNSILIRIEIVFNITMLDHIYRILYHIFIFLIIN